MAAAGERPRVHVIGAGMAGLSAAVDLASAGLAVTVYEAAPQAGGRCRSYEDPTLGCTIDNGNHLVMSGNRAIARYLDRIGAANRLIGPDEARYPFLDRGTGERFTVHVNRGPIPWWLLRSDRRVPGSSLADHLAGWRAFVAGPDATVADAIPDRGPLWRGFWEPLTLAAINTQPDKAQMRLLAVVLRETFAKGGRYALPRIARHSLADTFVDPALAMLSDAGASIRLGVRVQALEIRDERAAGFALNTGETVTLDPHDGIVLAVPPPAAAKLLPGLTVPTVGDPILNAHFRVGAPVDLPADLPLLGLLGSPVHWIFARDDIVSLTVSAADDLIDAPADGLARLLWSETAAALNLPADPVPPHRIVKEKRATFHQTPENVRRRPATDAGPRNVRLAGDWTATGLPATIEGSVTSGATAAASLLGIVRKRQIA